MNINDLVKKIDKQYELRLNFSGDSQEVDRVESRFISFVCGVARDAVQNSDFYKEVALLVRDLASCSLDERGSRSTITYMIGPNGVAVTYRGSGVSPEKFQRLSGLVDDVVEGVVVGCARYKQLDLVQRELSMSEK